MAYKYDIRAMLRKFGVVTVMNVKAYKAERYTSDGSVTVGTAVYAHAAGEWDSMSTFGASASQLFALDTLKIANINSEGPTKTITGGQNADTLLKYGKTFTIEMQDALGKYDVLHDMYGVNYSPEAQIAAVTDRFPCEMTLVGDTFVIDQATGAKQPLHIVIPIFLGDGIFNLTQDAEGDASVFDMNGSILKFNGGGFDGEPTGPDNRVDADVRTATAGNGKFYAAGSDNEFYFMCTDEVLQKLYGSESATAIPYEQAYAEITVASVSATESTTATPGQ